MLKYVRYFLTTLLGSVLFLPLYAKKPHPLAFKRYGIRIVAVTEELQPGEDLCNAAYEALVLLEKFGQEQFHLVKKHIRLVCLGLTTRKARYIPTSGLYFINVLRFPINFPAESLPVAIAGFLVRQATIAKLKCGVAHFDKANGAAVLEICKQEHLRTMQKLGQALRESQAG